MNPRNATITLVVINMVSYALLGFAAWGVHGACNQEFWMTIAVGVLGVITGWFFGFLASPSTPNESKRFSTYASVITTFASGYLVSKLDPVLNEILKNPERLATTNIELNLLVFASCLFSGALIMYIVRSYLFPGPRADTNSPAPGASADSKA